MRSIYTKMSEVSEKVECSISPGSYRVGRRGRIDLRGIDCIHYARLLEIGARNVCAVYMYKKRKRYKRVGPVFLIRVARTELEWKRENRTSGYRLRSLYTFSGS